MPSGGKNPYEAEGLRYGASVGAENVDFSGESHTESPGSRDRALIDRLKDALKPADAKTHTSGDTTHDGRHGGIEDAMKPSHHDYDKQEESMSHRGLLDALGDTTHERGGGGGRKGSVFDKIQFGHGQEERSKQNQNNSQGYHEGGGVMHALKEKVAVGKIESHRDSTDSTSADVGRLPGNLYASIRGDVSK